MAWNLRSLRTERGLSQERLAADAGVDRAWVSELEREQGNTSVALVCGFLSAVFFIIPLGGPWTGS